MSLSLDSNLLTMPRRREIDFQFDPELVSDAYFTLNGSELKATIIPDRALSGPSAGWVKAYRSNAGSAPSAAGMCELVAADGMLEAVIDLDSDDRGDDIWLTVGASRDHEPTSEQLIPALEAVRWAQAAASKLRRAHAYRALVEIDHDLGPSMLEVRASNAAVALTEVAARNFELAAELWEASGSTSAETHYRELMDAAVSARASLEQPELSAHTVATSVEILEAAFEIIPPEIGTVSPEPHPGAEAGTARLLFAHMVGTVQAFGQAAIALGQADQSGSRALARRALRSLRIGRPQGRATTPTDLREQLTKLAEGTHR